MLSLRLSSIRRLVSSAASLRVAPRVSATVPALCRAQLFSTSPFVRAGFGFSNDGGRSNDYASERRTPSTPFPPSPVVYVSNLPFAATAEDVQAAFGEFEGIQKITFGLLPDGRSRGFAHVTFDTTDNAGALINAHEESPFSFGEREISVAYGRNATRDFQNPDARAAKRVFPPSPSLYVGNLPYGCTEQDVRVALGSIGEISNIRVAVGRDGTPKGFAHVDFVSTEQAEQVFTTSQSDRIQIQGRDIRVDRAAPPTSGNAPSARLYFKGFTAGADELRLSLGEYEQKLVDVFALKDESGNPTGSGFIEFKSVDIATNAIKALDGTSLMGDIKFSLSYAKPQPPRREGGGERSRGGFGFSGNRDRGADRGSSYGGGRDRADNYGGNRERSGGYARGGSEGGYARGGSDGGYSRGGSDGGRGGSEGGRSSWGSGRGR